MQQFSLSSGYINDGNTGRGKRGLFPVSNSTESRNWINRETRINGTA